MDKIKMTCSKSEKALDDVEEVKKTITPRWAFIWVVGGLAVCGVILTGYFYGTHSATHDPALKKKIILERIDREIVYHRGGQYIKP